MTDDEFLRRIDEHLEISTQHMARGNEHMARGNELMAENHQAMEDIRFELSQMSMRGERVASEFIRELREHRKHADWQREHSIEQRGVLVDLVAEVREQRGVLADLVAEARAQREALFVILDEIRRGRGGPAAAGA